MAELLPTSEVPSRVTLEAVVRANEAAAREWVLALLQLHDRKLYKETHSSWDAYVLETFGYSHSTATRWLAQGREILALDAGPEDKAAGQDRPRAAGFPSQRQAAKAQRGRNKLIPAASTEAPAKLSEGREQYGETRPAPGSKPPSGKSSEGEDTAAASASPADPTSGLALDTESGQRTAAVVERGLRYLGDEPEPPRNDTGPVPTLRQEASSTFSALMDATEGIGAKWTPEEATAWENRSKREMDAWRAAHGLAPPAPDEKPQRRQETITRPGSLSSAVGYDGSARIVPTAARIGGGKRHADDCSCLSCVPPKAAAK